MRRDKKEIKNRAEIDDVINSVEVIRIAMCDGDKPYIVPLNFGYDGEAFYLHCALEGRKMDILKQNPNVCFELDILDGIYGDEIACTWGAKFRSVIGDGIITILSTKEEKIHGLSVIMNKYANLKEMSFTDPQLAKVAVIKIEILSITGKQGV